MPAAEVTHAVVETPTHVVRLTGDVRYRFEHGHMFGHETVVGVVARRVGSSSEWPAVLLDSEGRRIRDIPMWPAIEGLESGVLSVVPLIEWRRRRAAREVRGRR